MIGAGEHKGLCSLVMFPTRAHPPRPVIDKALPCGFLPGTPEIITEGFLGILPDISMHIYLV